MDKDKLRDRVSVMNAALNGARIQTCSYWASSNAASTTAMFVWDYAPDPNFDWVNNDYRVEPAPATRPLTKGELPDVCWLRHGLAGAEYLVVYRTDAGVGIMDIGNVLSRRYYWELMDNGWEYRAPGDTWKKCQKPNM